jgi:hypothetical protein
MGDENEPLDGFKWNHGYHGVTKGILFWDDVFLHDTENEKIAIIIMDTQGLFEVGADDDEDARIFGLSTLLSSILISNGKGLICEDQVQYLDQATKLAKFISGKKKNEWKPFQKILFLQRDWSHQDFVGYGYKSGQEYLKTALNEQLRPGSKSQLIRKDIYESFDEIKCYLLNNPGLIVTRKEYKGEWKQLESDFVKNLKILIESIFEDSFVIGNKKKVLGNDMTGTEFYDYVIMNFEAYQNAKIPETENIYDLMANSQLKAIVGDQIKFYRSKMSEKVDFDQENFEESIKQKHETAKAEAIKNFNEAEKIDDPERVSKHLELLKTEIKNNYENWKETTMRQYEAFSELKKHYDLQNENHKKEYDALQKKLEDQANEYAKLKKILEDEQKRQQEQADRLKAEIDKLNLTRTEKEEQIKEINADLKKLKEENDKKLEDEAKKHEAERKKLEEDLVKERNKPQAPGGGGAAIVDIGGILKGVASIIDVIPKKQPNNPCNAPQAPVQVPTPIQPASCAKTGATTK